MGGGSGRKLRIDEAISIESRVPHFELTSKSQTEDERKILEGRFHIDKITTCRDRLA
jgi:hypothetical protein